MAFCVSRAKKTVVLREHLGIYLKLNDCILRVQGKEEKETKQTVNPSTGKPMTFNESEMEMKVNVSVPGLSVQVISNSSSWKKPGLFTQGLYVRYYW